MNKITPSLKTSCAQTMCIYGSATVLFQVYNLLQALIYVYEHNYITGLSGCDIIKYHFLEIISTLFVSDVYNFMQHI